MITLQSMLDCGAFNNTTGCNIAKETSEDHKIAFGFSMLMPLV